MYAQTMVLASIAACLLGIQGPVKQVPYDYRSVKVSIGGFVTGLIFHPRAKDVLYARTDIGGAYRWEPRQGRWIALQDSIKRSDWTYYGIESLALDPQDARKVYLATGTYTNDWSGNGAIWRSNNQGRSWDIIRLPFKNGGNEDGRSMGERLSVDPANGKILLFGTRTAGLWRSVDGASTWAKVSSFPIQEGKAGGVGIGWVLFDAATSRKEGTSRIYVAPATVEVPLQVSEDSGKSWKPVPGAPKGILHHGRLAKDGTLYVTVSNHPGPNNVTDGSVWKRSSAGEWTDITPLKPGPEKTFGYAGLAVDPVEPKTVLVSTLCRWGADTVFRSRDGGKTWTDLAPLSRRDIRDAPYLKWDHEEPEFGHWIGDVEIAPFQRNRAFYVTGATIYRTEEAGNADRGEPIDWIVRGDGFEMTATIDLVSPPRGMHVMSALGDIGGFPHYDLDKPYPYGLVKPPTLNSVDSVDFAEARPEVLVRVGRSYGGNLHGGYTEDSGRTWRALASDPPGSTGGGGNVAISADAATILWSPTNGTPHLTKDKGNAWVASQGLEKGAYVVADRTDPSRFYAHNRGERTLQSSSNGGETFGGKVTLPPGEHGRLRAVYGQPSHLWLPTSEGLFRSRDGGSTWSKASQLTTAESVGFGKSQRTRGYPTLFVIGRIGSTEGIFRSIDEGETWVQVNDVRSGFGTMMHLCGDPKVFGRFYLGTNGRGVLVADPRTK